MSTDDDRLKPHQLHMKKARKKSMNIDLYRIYFSNRRYVHSTCEASRGNLDNNFFFSKLQAPPAGVNTSILRK